MALGAFIFSATQFVALYHGSRPGEARVAGLERASRIAPGDWRYPLELGRIKQAMGRPAEAAVAYREAISRFGACGPCWAGLAEAELAEGLDPSRSLENAVRFGRSQTEVRTRAAVVFARMGRDHEAAREFRAALGGHRWGDKQEFFSLLSRVFKPEFILASIVPTDDLEAYFSFARRWLVPSQVASVWKVYERGGAKDGVRLAYVDYLISHGLVHEAWRVGFKADAPEWGVVLNGDFEDSTNYGRFGWGLSDGEGVRARIVACSDCPSPGHALRLDFDGEHNVDYSGTRQHLAVEPGVAYRLKAWVRAEEISSARGPALAVGGNQGREGDAAQACKLWRMSKETRLSRPWQELSVDFTVPADCQGLVVMVLRASTDRLNKFVGGRFWVDDVVLKRLDSAEDTGEQAAASSLGGTGAGLIGGPVKGGRRFLAGEQHVGAAADQLVSAVADQFAGTFQRFGKTRRTAVDRVSVAGHGVEETLREQTLARTFGAASPNPEQGVAVQL